MKTAILLIFCVLILITSGCSGPGMTSSEVNRRHVNTMQTDWTLIQDDIDRIFFLDQPRRITEYHVR